METDNSSYACVASQSVIFVCDVDGLCQLVGVLCDRAPLVHDVGTAVRDENEGGTWYLKTDNSLYACVASQSVIFVCDVAGLCQLVGVLCDRAPFVSDVGTATRDENDGCI